MSLLDVRFVLVDDGEGYRTGEILSEHNDSIFWVRFDCMGEPERKCPLRLVHIQEMIGSPDGLLGWHFFDSKESRKNWIDWLNGPSSGAKVFSLVKRDTDQETPP